MLYYKLHDRKIITKAILSISYVRMLYFLSELLLILVVGTIVSNGSIFLDRNGCGKTKGCLFKPAGCGNYIAFSQFHEGLHLFFQSDPQLDCSIGKLIFNFILNGIRICLVTHLK